MLGAIIGDVVGSVYEFNNTRDYQFKLFTHKSNYTDDSIMTVAVADWAMHDPNHTQELLEETFLSYANDFPCPMGGYGGGFHTWLFRPDQLIDYTTGQPARKRCPYNSFGNGSAMRVSAVGWLFENLPETERIAGISAAITHNHPEGIKGAQATAAAVFLARNGMSKEEIRQYIERRFGYDLSTPWEVLHRTYRWDSSCQGTVPQAIIAFLDSTDYESALRRAISMGGDSDTIGAITGAIAEAFYRHIPMHMVIRVMQLLPPRMLHVLEQLRHTYYSDCYDRYITPYLRHRSFTPDRITQLRPNEIFVFGSNLKGYHGGGAAHVAFKQFGAEWGVGVGRTGQTYAIPTMQGGVDTIRPYVDEFIRYAKVRTDLKFLVTKIGCGIAGFSEDEIAPLFSAGITLQNVILPETFYHIILRHLNIGHEEIPVYKVNWMEEAVRDMPLTESQYASLCRGYQADWEFRYAPFKIGEWHYFMRSGVWVKKFRYERQSDGLYHLVQSYTAGIEMGRNLLFESFVEGYYNPRIPADDFRSMYYESGSSPLLVRSMPPFCPRCGHLMAKIQYGLPMHPVRNPRIILGGCILSPDNPHYQCPGCGLQCKSDD